MLIRVDKEYSFPNLSIDILAKQELVHLYTVRLPKELLKNVIFYVD